jgi:hypothetical protein
MFFGTDRRANGMWPSASGCWPCRCQETFWLSFQVISSHLPLHPKPHGSPTSGLTVAPLTFSYVFTRSLNAQPCGCGILTLIINPAAHQNLSCRFSTRQRPSTGKSSRHLHMSRGRDDRGLPACGCMHLQAGTSGPSAPGAGIKDGHVSLPCRSQRTKRNRPTLHSRQHVRKGGFVLSSLPPCPTRTSDG